MADTITSDELTPWALIVAERHRQVSVEGWTPEHDDQHTDGEMLRAAVIYLHHGTMLGSSYEGGLPAGWPWEAQWWKPKDRRSNLIRAGALCLAERDRLVRAGKHTGPADHKFGLVLRDLASPDDTSVKPMRTIYCDICSSPNACAVECQSPPRALSTRNAP